MNELETIDAWEAAWHPVTYTCEASPPGIPYRSLTLRFRHQGPQPGGDTLIENQSECGFWLWDFDDQGRVKGETLRREVLKRLKEISEELGLPCWADEVGGALMPFTLFSDGGVDERADD